MKRKIEFRVWNPDDKVMLYDNDDLVITLDGIVWSTFDDENEEEYVIQQYTGFKDLNNKKIYEGDIVELDDGRKKSISWNAAEGYWRVDYEDQNNGFDYDCLAMNSDIWNGPIKVVGNIFENPDLLK